MPSRFRHGVVDAEAVTAPIDEMRVRPHPRLIVKAARATQRRRHIAALRMRRSSSATVIAPWSCVSITVSASSSKHRGERPRLALVSFTVVSPAAAAISSNRSQASRVSRLRQHRQGRPRRRRRRGPASELVGVDDLAPVGCARAARRWQTAASRASRNIRPCALAPRDRPGRLRGTSAARRAAGTARRCAQSRLP